MGTSASTCLLILSFSLGQSTGTIEREQRDFQNEAYQQWWGTDFEWKFRELPKKATVSEKRVPYSGYIYPDQAGGTMWALQKYDRAFNAGDLRATTHEQRDTSSAVVTTREVTSWERVGLFGRRPVTQLETVYGVPHWYGHCNGWASAAIRHAEPQRSVKRHGVEFTPSDIKGLLAEIYMYNDEQMLAGDGTVINPGTFHAIVTNWLGRGMHPIAMDADPGEEKWNYPIYAYSSESVERSPLEVEVALNITHATSSQVEYDKSPRIARSRYFHYSLDLDDNGEIVGGSYYRDSSVIDMLWVPLRPKQGGHEGNELGNPHVDVKEVLALWRQSVPEKARKNWKIINPPNDEPVITSENAPRATENQLAVMTVTAKDQDLEQPLEYLTPQTLGFSLGSGADQSHFSIDAVTGTLTFARPPDFEMPSDVDRDNIYEVEVQVEDGAGGSTRQLIRVAVTDANDNPVITSDDTLELAENATTPLTITVKDVDLPTQTPNFSLSGGADQGLFSINATTGDLTFNAVPNFEQPTDADRDNTYEVEIKVDDGAGGESSRLTRVLVTDANDDPVITYTHHVLEHQTAVLTVAARDEDHASKSNLSLSGGADRAKFSIDPESGDVTFIAAPDFEMPSDRDNDNVYEIEVNVDDGADGNATQLIRIAVTDGNDDPVITSANTVEVQENQKPVLTVAGTDQDFPRQEFRFTIGGGADQAKFLINAKTGELKFKKMPNFEKPRDANKDNVYEVEVELRHNARGRAEQLIKVTITDVDESPRRNSRHQNDRS